MAPRRRVTFDLDLATAQTVVRRIDAGQSVASFARLFGGSSDVYRLDRRGASEPWVLKIYPDEPSWRAGKEVLVSAWMDGKLEVATPRFLLFDESRALIPFRIAVLTWLPGEPLRTFFGDDAIEDAYRQMGALLRKLHEHPMEAYGYVRDEGIVDPTPSNREHMGRLIESLFRRFRSAGADAALARRLEQIALGGLDLMAESAGPVFCHDDFHQGNVLVEPHGLGDLRISGVIDFGNARAADPLFDLAKALFICGHEDPRSRAPLLEGYGQILHSDPDRVLWLYTLVHRAIMWTWLIGIGADPMAEDGPGGLMRDLGEMV